MRVTAELRPGDRVRLMRDVVRTVATVAPHPDPTYINWRGERIWSVTYAEGNTPQWSGGNTCVPTTWWDVVTTTKEGSA